MAFKLEFVRYGYAEHEKLVSKCRVQRWGMTDKANTASGTYFKRYSEGLQRGMLAGR